MIIGGTSAGGKTNSIRTGYSERFLPCRAYILKSNVEAIFNQITKQAIVYTASVRIRNVADTAWITLSTCTYFQVTRGSEGDIDSADLTIAIGETWSAFLSGGTYEGVLKPSNRVCQILVGVIVGGNTYTIYAFNGRINRYTENIGGRSFSINIGLQDMRSQFLKTNAITTGYSQTVYRELLRQLREYSTATGSGNEDAIKFIALFPDAEITSAELKTGNVLDALESSIPSFQNSLITGSGVAFYGITESEQTAYTFDYSDKNIITLTRNASDGEQFNTVRIMYGTSAPISISEISDTSDVSINGKIYKTGYVGGFGYTLAKSTQLANELIAMSLRGTLTAELPLNPFLEPGTVIKISSTKYSVPASYARIIKLSHQYTIGRAVTYINEMKILTI